MNVFLIRFVSENFFKPGTALDLGAGKFFDADALGRLGWKVDGVDIRTGVDLENEYVSPEKPYDLVYSCYVWQKLKNKTNILKTAFDNLKDGGRVFFHTFDKSDKNSMSKFDSDEAKRLFAEAGFSNIEVKVFDFYDNDEGHKHWHKILEISALKP